MLHRLDEPRGLEGGEGLVRVLGPTYGPTLGVAARFQDVRTPVDKRDNERRTVVRAPDFQSPCHSVRAHRMSTWFASVSATATHASTPGELWDAHIPPSRSSAKTSIPKSRVPLIKEHSLVSYSAGHRDARG